MDTELRQRQRALLQRRQTFNLEKERDTRQTFKYGTLRQRTPTSKKPLVMGIQGMLTKEGFCLRQRPSLLPQLTRQERRQRVTSWTMPLAHLLLQLYLHPNLLPPAFLSLRQMMRQRGAHERQTTHIAR